jgi:hypothetical protein
LKNADNFSDFADAPAKAVCVRCRERFTDADNGPEACAYHPTESQTHLRVRNEYDRVFYPCCGKESVGTFPEIIPVPGCTRGRHERKGAPKDL